VDVYLNLFLAECIENDCTVIDNWNDKEYKDVLTYLLIAKENPDGNMYDEDDIHDEDEDEIDDDSINDVCCCAMPEIPSPIMMAPNVKFNPQDFTPTTTVNSDIEMPAEDWVCTEEGVIANPKDDVEPPVMDLEIEKERQRAVYSIINSDDEEDIPYVEAMEVPSDEGTWRPVADVSNAFDDDKDERDYQFGEIVCLLFRVREHADELQAMESSDFAQEVANATYIAVDSLTSKLLEITEKFNEKGLRKDIMLYVNQKS